MCRKHFEGDKQWFHRGVPLGAPHATLFAAPENAAPGGAAGPSKPEPLAAFAALEAEVARLKADGAAKAQEHAAEVALLKAEAARLQESFEATVSSDTAAELQGKLAASQRLLGETMSKCKAAEEKV